MTSIGVNIGVENWPDRWLDEKELNGSYVKLIVEDKGDYVKFDYAVTQLQSLGVADLKIIENLSVELEDGESVIETEDTMTLLDNYIDEIDLKVSKSSVKSIMRSLYMEASELWCLFLLKNVLVVFML